MIFDDIWAYVQLLESYVAVPTPSRLITSIDTSNSIHNHHNIPCDKRANLPIVKIQTHIKVGKEV